MVKLDKELELLEEFMKNSELKEKAVGFRTDHYRPYAFEDRYGLDGTARLRLDFEVADGEGLGPWQLMTILTRADLEDLLENGDVTNRSDPILSALDGSKKRGKELVDVTLGNAVCHLVHRPHKNTTEYTLWISVYGVWK